MVATDLRSAELVVQVWSEELERLLLVGRLPLLLPPVQRTRPGLKHGEDIGDHITSTDLMMSSLQILSS